MVPGLSSDVESRLVGLMDRRVTNQTPESLARHDFTILDANSAAAQALGVACARSDVSLVVTDPERRLGTVNLESAGANTLLVFDNRSWGGNLHANLRVLGNDSVLLFNGTGDGLVVLQDVFLRSHQQFLFWGSGATAVGLSIELEGNGRGVMIGDDALISSGCWIRNYDMHAVHDLRTGTRLNAAPCDTVIERHVWLGQDALLLSCQRVGAGAIVGARALVKGTAPACCVVGGTPARVLRQAVSWGRNAAEGMSAAERASLAGMYQL